MKTILRSSDGLTLRQRLVIVAVLCVLLCALPTWRLSTDIVGELRAVSAERAALPANEAWQRLLSALNAHRQACAALQASPDGEANRQKAAARVEQAFLEVAAALASTPEARTTQAQAIHAAFKELNGDIAGKPMQFAVMFKRHRALADRVIDEVEQLNADAGLMLDPDAGMHLAIVAGLQFAPQVGDALSELSSIATAAAVDDIGSVAGAAGRYNNSSHRLAQALEIAARVDSARAQSNAASRDASLKQQATVNQALEASAQDVNYPLDKMSAAFTEAENLQAQLADTMLEAVDEGLANRESRLQRGAAWLMGIIVLGLALTGMLLWRTIIGILRPVMQTIEATERIAAGDLSGVVQSSRRDEMGRVLHAIEGMQDRLRVLVRKLQDASGQIHVAADEIAAGNQDLSQRSEQSAARMEVAAGNLEQLSQTVASTAGAAEEASRLAGDAARSAQAGSTVVGQFLTTMTSISGESRRIAEITSVIDGIAFQTNILALNAAVEAARAGEQGRGFAVVASEVRALAQRSATAAREIKVLIGSSSTQVENGVKQVSEASDAMAQVTQSIEQVDQMIRGIARDAQEEAARMHELSANILQIDEMTQQNTALVEQSAAAAHSMNEQAEQMSNLAASFRLN